jgi:predicted Fe-Mo cluster-binding NifX family protein
LAQDEKIPIAGVAGAVMQKLMVIIQGDFVAPRFDLATEVLIVRFENNKVVGEPKMIIRERASDELLCQMAVEEHITNMICGGIEEVHFKFLVWKKIVVLDAVIGSWQTAVEKCVAGTLQQGEILISINNERLTL